MKTSIRLTAPGNSSSAAVYITDATGPAIPEAPPLPAPENLKTHQDVREMLHRRYTTPFPVVFPYRHGGLNE